MDYPLQYSWAFSCGSAGKESVCNAGIWGQSLGWEDSLEKGKATRSRILAWRILSITSLACEMSAIVNSLALPFLGIGMKTDLFQSCGHC